MEATRVAHLAAATEAATVVVVVQLDTVEHLQPLATGVKSSLTTSVIPLVLLPFIHVVGSVNAFTLVALHCWLARLEGLVPSSWYVPSLATNNA